MCWFQRRTKHLVIGLLNTAPVEAMLFCLIGFSHAIFANGFEMKYVFRPTNVEATSNGWKHWYEDTSATPWATDAAFFVYELHAWFRRMVFK